MTNQLSNPSFETNDLTMYDNASSATVSRVSDATAPDGGFVTQVNYLATSNLLFNSNPQTIAANPGESWSAGCVAKLNTGTARLIRVDILFLDASNAVLSTVNGTGVTITGSYVQYKNQGAVAPASTARVRLRITYISPVAGDGYLLDCVQLEQGSALPAYNPQTVTFDALGPSSTGQKLAAGTSTSWTHVCDNRFVPANLLLVGVAWGGANDTGVTLSATYDGVSMTSLGKVHSNGQTGGFIELFGLLSPSPGSNTVAVTASLSGTMEGGSLSYRGADLIALPTVTTAAGSGTGTIATLTDTIAAAIGDEVAAFFCAGQTISSTNQTQRILSNQATTSAAGNMAAGTATAAATSVAMTVTLSVADWIAAVGVDIKPYTAVVDIDGYIVLEDGTSKILLENGIDSFITENYTPPAVPMTASDDFNRATLGSNWITTQTPVTLDGTAVVGATAQNGEYWYAPTIGTLGAVFAQCTFLGGTLIGPAVAMPGFTSASTFSSTGSWYALRATGSAVALVQKDNLAGTYTALATTTMSVNAGDVLRLEFDGTTLNGYVNDVLQVTATPASPLSITSQPYVGFGHGASSQTGTQLMDNWSGGDTAFTVPATGGLSASDNFNRSDGALGSNWQTTTTPATIASNHVIGSTSSNNAERWAVDTNGDNQFSQATFIGAVGAQSARVGVALAMPSLSGTPAIGTTGAFYAFYQLASGGGVAIGRKEFGATTLTVLVSSASSVNFAVNDVIRLEYVNGVLTAFINGVQVLTTTPASHLVGQRGVGFYQVASGLGTSGSALLDDWSGGDYGAVTPTVQDRSDFFLVL